MKVVASIIIVLMFIHNIIGLILRGLAKKFGDNVAQAVVDGFELHDFGW